MKIKKIEIRNSSDSDFIVRDFVVRKQPDTEKVCKECDFRFYCSQNSIIKFKPKEFEEV